MTGNSIKKVYGGKNQEKSPWARCCSGQGGAGCGAFIVKEEFTELGDVKLIVKTQRQKLSQT